VWNLKYASHYSYNHDRYNQLKLLYKSKKQKFKLVLDKFYHDEYIFCKAFMVSAEKRGNQADEKKIILNEKRKSQ